MNLKCVRIWRCSGLAVLLLALGSFVSTSAQSPIDGIDARTNTTELAQQLGSPDPLLRQRSAEGLARLAAVDQRKLVEGYQLQEKNKEVKLALDWALYRMGRSEALFRIVKELDSGRQMQAMGYLSELESRSSLSLLEENEYSAACDVRIDKGACSYRQCRDARTHQTLS